MNTDLIARRFCAALPHYDAHADAQRQIAAHLMNMLPRNDYQRVLELGCGSGFFTRLLYRQIGTAEWWCNDLSEGVAPCLDAVFRQPYRLLAGDAAAIALPANCDLIAAASCLQWIDDLPRLLDRVATALSPRGVFLFNTFAPDNLAEIRALTGQGLSYPDVGQWQCLIAPHFVVREHRADKIVLFFDNALAVLRHLQKTGVTAAGEYRWTRKKLDRFARAYAARFSVHGRLSLTYTPLYYLLEKKAHKPGCVQSPNVAFGHAAGAEMRR